MKNIVLSAAAVFAMSSFAVAGGDIAPIEEPIVEVPEVVVTDSGFYLGLAYGLLSAEIDGEYVQYQGDFNEQGYSAEVDYDTIMLQAGYKFNSYVTVEGRYWGNFSDGDASGSYTTGNGDSVTFTGPEVDGFDVAAWGIYVKPMYPVTEAFDIYALLGYGAVVVSDAYEDVFDEDGFQWGLGAAYNFNDNVSIFVDYVKLYDDDNNYDNGTFDEVNEDTTVDTVNIGVAYKF
ncbi:MAG: outer membrane beta-barrel protein [Campylobacterota bacterium]|nr:outer membrane beta-barrel protein [Campylobacterota bacterium]